MAELAKPKDRTTLPSRKAGRGGAKDVFGGIVETVSHGIRAAVRGRGKKGVPLTEAVDGVVRGAVRASLEVGGSLVVGTKAILMGVLRGTGERHEAALKTLAHAARAVVRETSASQGDLRAAAMGLVLGAAASARGMGVVPSRAALAAVEAAVGEAEGIGFIAAEMIRRALREDVDVPAPASRRS